MSENSDHAVSDHIDSAEIEALGVNVIRGLAMGPTAYAMRDSKILKIHEVQMRALTKPAKAPGEIIDVGQQSFVVACGADALEVLELQPESKAKMLTADYLRGYSAKVGEFLT